MERHLKNSAYRSNPAIVYRCDSNYSISYQIDGHFLGSIKFKTNYIRFTYHL